MSLLYLYTLSDCGILAAISWCQGGGMFDILAADLCCL